MAWLCAGLLAVLAPAMVGTHVTPDDQHCQRDKPEDNTLQQNGVVFLALRATLTSHISVRRQQPITVAEQQKDAVACDLSSPARLLLACALVAASALFVLLIQLRVARRGREVASEIARSVGCYFAMLDAVLFSVVIPDSFDIIVALGGGAILSGTMIGAHKFGTAIGAVVFYCVLRTHPDVWRTRARRSLAFCAICNITGTATYAFVATAADSGRLLENEPVRRGLLIAVFVGRILGGCGSGVRLMLSRTHIARLTPVEERPAQQSRFLFAITLGMGVGPLLVAAVKLFVACKGDRRPRFVPAGVAGLTLSCCQLVAALNVRSVANSQDLLDKEESSAASLDEQEIWRRRRVVLYGLAFSVLRGLCLSGVEAASAMLLEVKLGWHPLFIGATIGLAFLTAIPLRLLYLATRHRLSTVTWMQALIVLSLLGSSLLFNPPFISGSMNTQRFLAAAMLLVGDCLLFPCFFLSDGLVQGLILQHPLSTETSVFNLNGVNLMNTLFLDGFARVVGPSLSRYHVSTAGRNAYALQQLLLTLAAGLVLMFGFLPNVRASQEGQLKVNEAENEVTTVSTREPSN